MYAFSYEVPGNETFYRRINDELGEAPEGLVVHLVVESEGGLRHINVWSSQAEWERYRDERVRPAVNKVLAQAGIPEAPPPHEEPMKIVGVIARDSLASSPR